MKKIIYFFLLLTIVISLNSCISIERVIKLNEDGSGKETMTINYSKDFFAFIASMAMAFDTVKGKSVLDSIYNEETFTKGVNDNFKKIKGIKINDLKAKMNSDSSMTITVNYNFDNIELLEKTINAANSNSKSEGLGLTKINFKEKGKNIVFSYLFEQEKSTDTSNQALKESFSTFFKGQKMTFKIEFPNKIKSSNAHEKNGKKLIWVFDMEKIINDSAPIKLEAVIYKK